MWFAIHALQWYGTLHLKSLSRPGRNTRATQKMCLKTGLVTTFYISAGKACSQGPAEMITPLPSAAWSKQVYVHLSQSQDGPLDFPFSARLPLLSWHLRNIYSVLPVTCTVGMFQHFSLSLNKTFKSCYFLAPHLLHKEKFFVRRRTKHMTKFPFNLNKYIVVAYSGLGFLWGLFLLLLQVGLQPSNGRNKNIYNEFKEKYFFLVGA